MRRLLVAIAVALAFASPATAGQVKIYSTSYQSGSGGEFTYVIQSPIAGFDTGDYASTTKDQGGFG